MTNPLLASRRPLCTAALGVAVLLAGCTAPGTGASASDVPDVVPSTGAGAPSPPADAPEPSSPVSAGPTSSTGAGGAPALDATCVLPQKQPGMPQVQLSFPSAWELSDPDAGRCGLFDPGDPAVPAASEPGDVAVAAYVDAVAFAETSRPGQLTEQSRRSEQVDGRPAVRLQGATTDAGLGPAGRPRTTWLVDVGVGTRPATLVLVSPSTDDGDVRVEALDAIAASARVLG